MAGPGQRGVGADPSVAPDEGLARRRHRATDPTPQRSGVDRRAGGDAEMTLDTRSTIGAAPETLFGLRSRTGAALVAATVLASMVAFLDAYMINVAVPAI